MMNRELAFLEQVIDLFNQGPNKIWNAIPVNNMGLVNSCWEMKSPPTDFLLNKDGTLKIRVALAGYESDSINLSIENDSLILKVDTKKEESDEWRYLGKNIKGSSFTVKFAILSSNFDRDKIEPSFKDGILEITIPIKEGMGPKQLKLINK